MRFWFAIVSPYYQSISKDDFAEFEAKWTALRGNFYILLSNQLILDLVKQSLAKKFEKDPIISIGSYYDKKIQITILAKRKSGKLIAGECKYSKDEAKINMIINLKEKCQKAQLDVDELLLDNLSEKDLLVYKNKQYAFN